MDVTALPQWPEPDALARKVVAALNAAEKDKAGTAEYRLSAEGAPKLQGGVSLEGQDDAGGSEAEWCRWDLGGRVLTSTGSLKRKIVN